MESIREFAAIGASGSNLAGDGEIGVKGAPRGC